MIYALPSDEQVGAATLTLSSGTADAEYPLTNLQALAPARPTKFTTTSAGIVINFGSPVALKYVAIMHPNFQAALNVRWQRNATDSWGAPSVDRGFTVAATDPDGYVPGPSLDLTGEASYQYARVSVPTNDVNLIIGAIVAYTAIYEATPILNPFKESDHRLSILHETAYGVQFVYDLARYRGLSGSMHVPSSAQVLTWYRSSKGRAMPFLVMPRDEAMLARWDTDAVTSETLGPSAVRWSELAWREVSRGLPWR